MPVFLTCYIATAADLKSLELYSALLSLPKSVDPEHDPMRKGVMDDLTLSGDSSSRQETPEVNTKLGRTREPTQRELARLKNKNRGTNINICGQCK